MTDDVLTAINTRKTPQKVKARDDQVKNRAGGYVFKVGDEAALHRFLTLGTDGPTYYAKAIELTRENADVVFRMAATKPDETIQAILDVSEAGRAPKNNQAIFALAIVASAEDPETRRKALAVMHKVCRTGTHLFLFNKYVLQFRGRGPTLLRALGDWYKLKDTNKLAYQAVKYRSREDWSHRDLLRLVKHRAGKTGQISGERDALLGWIARGVTPERGMLPIVDDFTELQALGKESKLPVASVTEVIGRGNGVSWEMLPDAALKEPVVWEALLAQGMPQTALMRQLPRLTNVFGKDGSWAQTVAAQLQDAEALKRGRVHPINVLMAQRTYASGHGVRGKSTWTPVRRITNALDAAFYNAYGAVEPSGKRTLVALDVSASMSWVTIGDTGLQPREAAAALALVTLATEPNSEVVAFTSSRSFSHASNFGITPVDITPRRRLDDVMALTSRLPAGGTDCALPFVWAAKQGLDFETVIILTDNESWAGPIHVHQAATQYRNGVGHDVKLVAVGMTATGFSVVDPKDPSGLNVSGFDSAVPQLIADFAANRL